MSITPRKARLAADIGGTFTDVVIEWQGTLFSAKVPMRRSSGGPTSRRVLGFRVLHWWQNRRPPPLLPRPTRAG
jgi:hypothetical protein